MSLNPLYVPDNTLWELFTDKNLLTFLANGYVKFWIDTARTVGNPVYQLTGSPPNYTYIQYGFLDTDGGWRVNLNQQGAFDSTVYYYPYDSNGNVQLYFIQVYSSDAVVSPILQFTREGWPNVAGSAPSGNTEVIVNYVPNPQFLLHLNIQANPPTTVAGQITGPTTDIAWGGWTYERPNSSTATDIITFPRFGSDVTSPEKSPRYSLRFQCESPSAGDTFKDICLEFTDVNKFSSSTQNFTFSFYAQINSGSSLPASIILYKNYGTGGSTPTETVLSTISIGNSWALYSVSFIFGLNTSSTIGTLNDDYLQLIVRLPLDSIFDVSFDDFNLAEGQIMSPSMPYTADSQMIYRSLAGFLPNPNPDGSDLYLPTVLTPTGMIFDHSEIGKIYTTTYTTAQTGQLLCDGSQYQYSKYSSDGIPYYRLGNVLWNNTGGFYAFGTGASFVSSQIVAGNNSAFRLTTNSPGSVTAPVDGGAPTGFTFFSVYSGSTTLDFTGYYSLSYVFIENNTVGAYHAEPGAGTSGFTLNTIIEGAPTYAVCTISGITAATGLAGKYFLISNTTIDYYVWFTVDGSGSDPAVAGRTGIKINLQSTFTSIDVAGCISESLSGKQVNTILVRAGSLITPNSYFDFNTLTQAYYVWYNVGGTGVDPTPPGKIGIEVNITTSDAIALVASETAITINKMYYAVPDLRGAFLRGIDLGSGNDPEVSSRFNTFSTSYGDEIGTIQLYEVLSHYHNITTIGPDFVGTGGTTVEVITPGSALNTANYGGIENRPQNIYVNYVIKY